MKTTKDQKNVELVVRGGFVLTMDDSMTIHFPGSVAVSRDRIVAVGSTKELDTNIRAEKILDATGQVVMPGLINTHTHLGMGYLRGMGDGMTLYDWRSKITVPVRSHAVAEDNYATTMVGCVESIRGGVTTVCDTIDYLPAAAAAVKETGIRAIISLHMNDENDVLKSDELIQETKLRFEQFHDTAEGRIRLMVAVHAPYSCSEKLLKGARELADHYMTGLNMHLAESLDEEKEILAHYGLSPTQYAESIGLLGPDLLAAHFVWVSDTDIQIAAKHGIKIAHNPASNLKLASGISPVPKLLQNGIVVGLGTDSSVSSNRLDIFEAMKLASLIHNGVTHDPLAITPYQVLKMATCDGARAIGLDRMIGSLEVGKKADFITIDFRDKSHLTPHFFEVPENIISHLVYAIQSSDVRYVVINGRVLFDGVRVVSVDEKDVIAEAQARAQRLLLKAGILLS